MARPIVLWDIDGTILRAPRIGVRAFAAAVAEVTGSALGPGPYDFGGKTDPLICADLLAAIGVGVEQVPPVLDALVRAYEVLDDDLRAALIVLPGVAAAIDAFGAAGARQTVVTGNIEPVARRKVAAAGFDGALDLDRGGFGSDHHERAELVGRALERLGADPSGGPIEPSSVWVIGDTPRDAACARDAGVRCVLVATGTYTEDALADHGADAVLADLSDLDRLSAIVGFGGTTR